MNSFFNSYFMIKCIKGEIIMKKIGIIFAMEEELMEFKKRVSIVKEYQIFDLTFYECNIDSLICIFVESGVGKVNAARCTQIMIDRIDVSAIINVGVAGGISKDLQVCDLVIADKLVQHDFDITAFGHEKGYIPNIGTFTSCDSSLVSLAKLVGEENNNKIHIGTIASGDIFCTETKMSQEIYQNFHALCVEMEGASIAQVCQLCNIPFLVIRSISDVLGSHNVLTYEEFLSQSCYIVTNYIIQILKKIK